MHRERRKRFIQCLRKHPLVDTVDFTRDGYQTVVLQLGDPGEDAPPTELAECEVCGALGLPERIREHDCESFREWRADS
jgi:hypothetical protein